MAAGLYFFKHRIFSKSDVIEFFQYFKSLSKQYPIALEDALNIWMQTKWNQPILVRIKPEKELSDFAINGGWKYGKWAKKKRIVRQAMSINLQPDQKHRRKQKTDLPFSAYWMADFEQGILLLKEDCQVIHQYLENHCRMCNETILITQENQMLCRFHLGQIPETFHCMTCEENLGRDDIGIYFPEFNEYECGECLLDFIRAERNC